MLVAAFISLATAPTADSFRPARYLSVQASTAQTDSRCQGADIVALAATPSDGGFWLASSGGTVSAYGDAEFYGPEINARLTGPMVDFDRTPSGQGYWLVDSGGAIYAFGDARFFGSTGNLRLNSPVTAMAPTPTGRGYWMVAADGGIFAFGDAVFYGSTGGRPLRQPIIDIEPTSTGKGYWLTGRDGAIFAYGDAPFFGSTENVTMHSPVVDFEAAPTDRGYRIAAADGGMFTFGDTSFLGSALNRRLFGPVVDLEHTSTDQGYWLAAGNGAIFAFGDAAEHGSAAACLTPDPVDFGAAKVATSGGSRVVTVISAGSASLTARSVTVEGRDRADFSRTVDGCSGRRLAPGQECRVEVDFRPTGPGNREAVLSVAYERNGVSRTALRGTGTILETPAAAVSPDMVDFGLAKIGTTGATRQVTVTSTGTAPLAIAGAVIAGDHPGDFEKVADGCSGRALPPTLACRIDVRFRSTDAGHRRAILQVSDNGADSPRSVELRGGGTTEDVAAATLTPTSLDFGEGKIGTPGPLLQVAVISAGSAPLSITSVATTGSHPGDFPIDLDGCSGRRLRPEQRCLIGVRFQPTQSGPRRAKISVVDNAADSPQMVELAGNGTTQGVQPSLVLRPPLGPPGFVTIAQGSGFEPSSTLELTWRPGIGRVAVRTDADGAFRVGVLVHRFDRLGRRALVARSAGVEAVVPFLVVPNSSQPPDFTTRS